MQTITTRQARQADASAIEHLAIPSIVLMENAALHASRIAGDLLGTAEKGDRQRVVILAGGGNNGGDGYAMARQLRTVGHDIHIIALRDPQKLKRCRHQRPDSHAHEIAHHARRTGRRSA